jgi:hypothetical protein
MPLAIGMLFEPRLERLDGKRLRIEGNRRIHDVVVIDLRQPGQVGAQPGRVVTSIIRRFSLRSYSIMRREEPQAGTA